MTYIYHTNVHANLIKLASAVLNDNILYWHQVCVPHWVYFNLGCAEPVTVMGKQVRHLIRFVAPGTITSCPETEMHPTASITQHQLMCMCGNQAWRYQSSVKTPELPVLASFNYVLTLGSMALT